MKNQIMLTREHAIADLDFRSGMIYPDRLTQASHAHYKPVAEKLLKIYATGIGMTRRNLHQQVEQAFESIEDCPAKRIAAFAKLLDDVSQYETDRNRNAAKLRKKVFRAAAKHHPLVTTPDQIFDSDQGRIKHKIARNLKTSWPEIERTLFADVIEFHPLKSFSGYATAAELLARYNVAQVQACLYRAQRMTIWAGSDLKTIVRAIKLSRLMHSIRRPEAGRYQFILDGPASALRSTRRYGVAMAKMIPILLACRDWKMTAQIAVGQQGNLLLLQLSSQDGLHSDKTISTDFDSQVERDLMAKWTKSPLENWTLDHESELLHGGLNGGLHGGLQDSQKVFTPDFVATHKSGQQIFVEIIGYWTPEYLQAKAATVKQFANHPILLIAQQDKQQALETLGLETSSTILWYKTAIPIKQFKQSLEDMRQRIG